MKLLCCCLLTLSGAAVAAPAEVQPEARKEYLLTHKSSFEMDEGSHNPFWPIGFKPMPAGPDTLQVPQAAPPIDVHAEDFVITTISLERDAPLAVINGRTHGVGDRLPVGGGGKDFVTVRRIMDGAVEFDFHGQTIKSIAGRRGPAK